MMMRVASAAALFLVVAAAAAAAPQVNGAPLASPEGSVSCGECQLIVGILQKASGNASTLAEFAAAADALVCDKKFNGTLRTICTDVVNLVVEKGTPWIVKQLEHVAWDIPLGVCSAFVHACKQPCCDSPYAPEQLHLSLTNTPSEMAVTWVTLNSTTTSEVQWQAGVVPGGQSLSSSAQGSPRTYTQGGWIGVIHTAVMTGLSPGKSYTYRVGDSSGGWSNHVTFHTADANVGTAAVPLRVAQIADTGFGDESNDTVAALTELATSGSIDLLIHNGDVGYADGFEGHWDIFMRKMEPIVSRVPVMVTPGNHEIWYDFAAYKARFSMPKPAGVPPTSKDAMFYSFDVGNTHFAMLDTESAIDTPEMDKDQISWLTADLNASKAAWTIAAGHRPFYCSDPGNKIQCTKFAAYLRSLAEDILYSAKVDLVIQGHEHDMERSLPVYKGNPVSTNYTDPAAPVYVVNGAGGNREGNSCGGCGGEPWSAWHSADRGYGMLTIKGNSMTYDFTATNGTVLDTFTIVHSS